MKPTLERMIDQIVGGMTAEARDFYEREFGFFGELTSISGKLKPYIKKTKPEKKVRSLREQQQPYCSIVFYTYALEGQDRRGNG